MKLLLVGALALLPFLPSTVTVSAAPAGEEGFVSLFDGKSLDGWKIGQNPTTFSVQDGVITMEYPKGAQGPAHLFYVGEVGGHAFKNFDLRVEVMTFPGANSGIYFHTKYQESEWPRWGMECQVDNSHSDWRRTGSLYGLSNISWGPEAPGADNKQKTKILPKAPVVDNVWYTQEIICRNGFVTVKLDGVTMVEEQIPQPDSEHKLETGMTWMPSGTFALQGHPPMRNKGSKACFRNIRVKILPD